MNETITTKKKLSGLSIVSMIGAMIFAIAAALMFLLPVNSSGTTMSTLELSVIGENGSGFMKNIAPFLGTAPESEKTFWNLYLVEVIAATVAFFGLIATAVMIILGKALQFKKGGRVLAMIFSLLGVIIAGAYLVVTILYMAEGNKLYNGNTNVGIGPILMASFAVVAFIFCCFGMGEKSAFKTVKPVNKYDPNSYYSGQNNPTADPVKPAYPSNNAPYAPVDTAPQPVQPQNVGYVNPYAPPAAPQPAPVPQPAPQPAPVPQPVPQPAPAPQTNYTQPPVMPQPAPIPVQAPVDDNQPTKVQNGAIEGISGDYAGAVIQLKPGEKLIIGRDAASCNLVLSSLKKDISRKHLTVEYDSYTDSFKVVDTSSNGTFVNGQQLVKDQQMQFPAGTVLSLGSGENQFRLKKI